MPTVEVLVLPSGAGHVAMIQPMSSNGSPTVASSQSTMAASLRSIMAEHHIGEVIIAMQQPGVKCGGRCASASRRRRRGRDGGRAGQPWLVVIALQQRPPARHCRSRKPSRLAEIAETGGEMIDAAERQRAVDQRKAHPAADRGIARMQRRQRHGGMKPSIGCIK